MINKKQILETKNLEEAIMCVFKEKISGRKPVLKNEGMFGEVAFRYNEIGKTSRMQTYSIIAEDFKNRVEYNPLSEKRETILEIGSGSGLLSLELSRLSKNNPLKIIQGIEISLDMLKISQENLEKLAHEDLKEIKEFEKIKLGYMNPLNKNLEKKLSGTYLSHLKENLPLLNRVSFQKGSVYNLENLTAKVNYIVCRNALHRFNHPEKAILKMYNQLKEGGKIYLRDLKRDANWKILKKRMGKERWNYPQLIEDYIGAMSGALTISELKKILNKNKISSYTIQKGDYIGKTKKIGGMNEFADKTEYVCIIKKENKQ